MKTKYVQTAFVIMGFLFGFQAKSAISQVEVRSDGVAFVGQNTLKPEPGAYDKACGRELRFSHFKSGYPSAMENQKKESSSLIPYHRIEIGMGFDADGRTVYATWYPDAHVGLTMGYLRTRMPDEGARTLGAYRFADDGIAASYRDVVLLGCTGRHFLKNVLFPWFGHYGGGFSAMHDESGHFCPGFFAAVGMNGYPLMHLGFFIEYRYMLQWNPGGTDAYKYFFPYMGTTYVSQGISFGIHAAL